MSKNNIGGAHVSERTPPTESTRRPSRASLGRLEGGRWAAQGRARGGGCSRHEPPFYERLLLSGGGFSHSPKLALKYAIYFTASLNNAKESRVSSDYNSRTGLFVQLINIIIGIALLIPTAIVNR